MMKMRFYIGGAPSFRLDLDAVPFDPVGAWGDYITAYETQLAAMKMSVDDIVNGSGTSADKAAAAVDYAKQRQHLRNLKSVFAGIEQAGSCPEDVTFGIGGAVFAYNSNVDNRIHLLHLDQQNSSGDINHESIPIGTFLVSDQFTISATASYDYASPSASADNVSFGFYTATSSGGNVENGVLCSKNLTYWHRLVYTATGNVFNGGLYDTVFTNSNKSNQIWGYPCDLSNLRYDINPASSKVGVPISAGHISQITLAEHTVNGTEPWDYYNSYILPDITAGNAIFPNGYTP